jgi:hypothetical protein
MLSDTRSLRCGQGCRSTASSTAPSTAAITARAEVRNSGENPADRTRVAGSEPLKMITPSRPLPQPSSDAPLPAVRQFFGRVLPCQVFPGNVFESLIAHLVLRKAG